MANLKKLPYIILIIVMLLIFCGCQGNSAEVCIHKDSGDTINVKVEVARTPIQRNFGLMYRKSLPEGKGMLFIFDTSKKQSFTMNNTFIPLDIIFVDKTKKIVGWMENTKPLTKGPYEIEKPSQYVLEVNAFFCKRQGVSVGNTISFKNIAIK